MFVYVLFLVGILCTLATMVLGETVYIVKQTQHNQAARYAQLIAEQSTTLYLLHMRSQISSGGAGSATGTAWSMHGSSCDSSVTNCPYTYTAQALASSGTGAAPNALQPSNDSAINLQRSYMGEQRSSAQLRIAITDKNGNIVSRIVRSLTLRTFSADPWVMISGNKEWTTHSTDDTSAQGDTGGVPAQPGDLPAPNPNYPDGFRDTRIHVTVQCVNDGVGTHGNEPRGGIQVTCANAPSPAPADAFDPSPQPWHNIGAPAAGEWSK